MKGMSYRIGPVLLALVIPCVAAAQGKGETVRIQDWPGTGNMLARVAISKGYCDKYGIKCTLQTIPSAPLGLQALLSKSIDIAMPAMEIQIAATQKGSGLKTIAGAIVTNAALMVIRAEPLGPNAGKDFPQVMQDLKGKKIAVPARNAAAEWISNLVIARAGLKPEDVTYVATGGVPTTMAALQTKQVDAVVHVEPSGAICEVEKWCRIVWRGSTNKEPVEVFNTNGAQIVHTVRQDQVNEIPHVIAAYQSAVKDSEAFLRDPKNFDEAVLISEQFFKQEGPSGRAITIASLRSTMPGYRATISRPAVKALVDFMAAAKQLDKPMDPAALLHDKAP